MKQYTVAVLGATGAVGQEMIKILQERNFPVGKLVPLASARSAGKTLTFKGEEVTIELAREMIDKYVKSTAKDISIEYIQKIICDYFKIPIDQINTTCRKREISQARQLSMYFARKHTKLPLSSIGEHCGHRDHATVLHACRTIENLLDTDKKMKMYVEDIEKKMKI